MTQFFKKFNLKKTHLVPGNKGQVVLTSVFFVFLATLVASGLVSSVTKNYKNTSLNLESKQTYYLGESGVEDAFYRVKEGKTINSPVTIDLNGGTASTSIIDSGADKVIFGLGSVSNRQRSTALSLSKGIGVSFNYGLQSGNGGFIMGNGSLVQGNVYSNGNITGSGSITGSATSGNSSALSADQENGTGVPSNNVTFGDTNNTQDFAQGFQVTTTGLVNKVELYLKKVSTPANLTVRIVTDNAGVPSSTTLASGTLSASLVSLNYGWIDVPLSSNPELSVGTTYWIVIDGATNATKHYIIGASNGVYLNSNSKIGKYAGTWNNNNPASLDGFFKVYLGGFTGLINGISVGTGSTGDAYAHTIDSSTVHGAKYCQVTNNSPVCNTSLPDPTQVAMPISDQNILDWKDEALTGGVHSGNYTVNSSNNILGPKKITGNLIVSNGAVLTLTGTVWVVGTINLDNNGKVKLDPSYGAGDGVLLSDGNIDISNNADFSGSGLANSYVLVLSTSTSTSAINLGNNAGAAVLYAANGTVNILNNASVKSVVGKTVNLSNNANIGYDSGLVDSTFTSGPSGGWNAMSWMEVE